MSWKTPLAVLLPLCALGAGVLWAETAAPLDWKPSVLLRASTGDLPTHNLTALAAAERAKVILAEQDTAKAKAEAVVLYHSAEEILATIEALRERVIEKQAEIDQVRL